MSFLLELFLVVLSLSTTHAANDGHDTDVTFAGNFMINFLPPLLKNPNFNDDRTLVFVSKFFFFSSKILIDLLTVFF